MLPRQHVISVSYDAEAAKSLDGALKKTGLFVSQLHSLHAAFIVIGHQSYAAVVFHPCVPYEDISILSILARWRSRQHRVFALHTFPVVSPADVDLCVLGDTTTIVKCINDLIEERPRKIDAMRSNCN
jgi:hypothetical protein